MVRITQHNEPITAVFPDGRKVYFRNRSEAVKRYGLTIRKIEDLLVMGETFHAPSTTWGGKTRLCVQAEGARFEYTIDN